MMWDNYPPRQNYRRNRRWRGAFGFPWIIIGLMWLVNTHLWWLFLVGIMISLFFFALSRSSQNTSMMNGQQPYYTPPVYQPPYQQKKQTSYYQPSYTPPTNTAPEPDYPSYMNGYQSQTPRSGAQVQDPASTSSAADAEKAYQDYEQPTAEYPEQMPPM
ncbi:MAG TPA: resistance to Congo red protein [Dictyobacter sp.]|nr:resistance to Congo red protein [Dictyobacter sp.]